MDTRVRVRVHVFEICGLVAPQFSTLIDCIMSPASLTNLVSRGDECECDAEYMYVSIGHE